MRFIDWRIWSGLALSALYLGYGGFHVFVNVGWTAFTEQPLENLGSFLEGAFAPLAFLWLVIGYFLQHKALMQNNANILLQYQEMRRSSEQAEKSANAIAANEQHARQETFLDVANLVNTHLGVVAGMLYLANQTSGPDAKGDDPTELWRRVSENDYGVFSRLLIDLCYSRTGRLVSGHKVFFGSNVRRRHTSQFIEIFERLLAQAQEADPAGLIPEALMTGTAHGHVYRTIKAYESTSGGEPS